MARANRKHANIGISLPGTGETPAAPVFVDGEKTVTLRGSPPPSTPRAPTPAAIAHACRS
jgi:hypothetical protein